MITLIVLRENLDSRTFFRTKFTRSFVTSYMYGFSIQWKHSGPINKSKEFSEIFDKHIKGTNGVQ
jgi:hypothetical protein